MKEYIEYKGEFWDIIQKDKTITTRYGKIGTTGEIIIEEFKSEKKAIKAFEKLMIEYTLALDTLEALENEAEDIFSEEEKKNNYQPQYSKEFSFFGAGNATYFEAFNLTIYFYHKPDKKQQKEILKLLPSHLSAEKEDFKSYSLNIYNEYGYDAVKSLFNDDFSVENTQTETALIKINKIAPIFFTYRPEDTEAEGTEFSQWHKDSDPTISVEVVEMKLDELTYEEINDLKTCLKEIYTLYGLKGKDKSCFRKKWWNPKKPPINNKNLIQKLKNGKGLREINNLLYNVYKDNTYHKDTFYQLFKSVKTKNFQEKILHCKYISEIITYAQEVKDTKTIAFFTEDIIIETFNDYMVGMLNTEQLIKFVNVYFPLLPDKSDKIDLANINNVLWDFIANNERKIPVNKKRNKLLLDKALKYAPQNSTIYYNASCMYAEMNEIGNSYDCILKTQEYKLDKRASYNLLNELKIGNNAFEVLNKDKKYEIFINDFQEKLDKRFYKPKNIHKDAIFKDDSDIWIYATATQETYWNKKGKLIEIRTYLNPRTYDYVYYLWSAETYDFVYTEDGEEWKGRSKDGYSYPNKHFIGEVYFCIGEKKYLKNKEENKKFNWYSKTSFYNDNGREVKEKTNYFDIDGKEIFKK